MSFTPTATVIADSINPQGDRLTTIVATYHRFIHSEFMTHRCFSRNASSSRAIPTEKLIQKVIEDNVYPLHWGANQRGMQAREELDNPTLAIAAWDRARECAIHYAKQLAANGVHKQIVNRVLEPFSTITTIVTATEWENFFKLRCHPDAQPEIQALAIAMMDAYQGSIPRRLDWGDWHIPFIKPQDIESGLSRETLIKVSVGRCARVSYLNHDGTRDIQKDLQLHDRLLLSSPPHLSPFEHMAKAGSGQWANFKGWQSYRNQLEKNPSGDIANHCTKT